MQYKCFNVIRKWNWTDAAESKLNSACILNIFIIFYRIKKNPIMRKFDSRFKVETNWSWTEITAIYITKGKLDFE